MFWGLTSHLLRAPFSWFSEQGQSKGYMIIASYWAGPGQQSTPVFEPPVLPVVRYTGIC